MSASLTYASPRDLSSWYRGTIVCVRGEDRVGTVIEVTVDDEDECQLLLETFNGTETTVQSYSPEALEVKYPEPYFSDQGEVQGSITGRNYKRAPVVPEVNLRGMWNRLFGEERVQGRNIGFQYFIKPSRIRISRRKVLECDVVTHVSKGVVGFKRGNELRVFDRVHYDRLRELLQRLGGEYELVPSFTSE